MLQVNAQAFYSTSADLQVMRQMVIDHGKNGADLKSVMTPDDTAVVLGLSQRMAVEVAAMGARVALAAVNRIVSGCESATLTYDNALNLSIDVNNRLRDELDGRLLFCLSDLEVSFFNPVVADEYKNFIDRFPSARFDVEECGKCFAFERYTASVFHALRVAEFGIRALARCLGIDDPLKPAERNWGHILRSVKVEIDQRWKSSDRASGDGALFEDLYATLDAIRNPLRNATMHPQQAYTAIECYDIIRNIMRFMRKVADRCDESGKPRARKKKP